MTCTIRDALSASVRRSVTTLYTRFDGKGKVKKGSQAKFRGADSLGSYQVRELTQIVRLPQSDPDCRIEAA